jgi:PadR family transcriptional regulator AphA
MKRPVPDQVILGLIKAKPAHGYELLDKFNSQAHLGRIWTMSTSQLYAVLKRLEESSLITGMQIETEGAPPRIIYTITESGEDDLLNWLFDPNPPTSVHRLRIMFLSRLYIADILNLPVAPIFANQRKVCIDQIEKFQLEKAYVGSKLEMLTIGFIIGQLESAIEWLVVAEKGWKDDRQ